MKYNNAIYNGILRYNCKKKKLQGKKFFILVILTNNYDKKKMKQLGLSQEPLRGTTTYTSTEQDFILIFAFLLILFFSFFIFW